MYMVRRHTCRQSTHTHKVKNKTKTIKLSGIEYLVYNLRMLEAEAGGYLGQPRLPSETPVSEESTKVYAAR